MSCSISTFLVQDFVFESAPGLFIFNISFMKTLAKSHMVWRFSSPGLRLCPRWGRTSLEQRLSNRMLRMDRHRKILILKQPVAQCHFIISSDQMTVLFLSKSQCKLSHHQKIPFLNRCHSAGCHITSIFVSSIFSSC